MKLAVFGANGPTGRLVTQMALDESHGVVAFTRHSDAFPFEHRRPEVDPQEAGSEAPDDIGHVDDPAVLGDGEPVAHVDDPADARDVGRDEILRLHPDERRCAGEEMASHLAADGCADRRHVVTDEPDAASSSAARYPASASVHAIRSYASRARSRRSSLIALPSAPAYGTDALVVSQLRV
jgi:hypothetical protein